MASIRKMYSLLAKYIIFFVSFIFIPVTARIHTLDLKYDVRPYFTLSSFGFYKDGYLKVHLKNFQFEPFYTNKTFGFSLDKTTNDAISPYLENHQDRCVIDDDNQNLSSMNIILFRMDFIKKKLRVTCSSSMNSLYIGEVKLSGKENDGKRSERSTLHKLSDSFLLQRKKRSNSLNRSTEVTEKKVNVELTTKDMLSTKEMPKEVTKESEDSIVKDSYDELSTFFPCSTVGRVFSLEERKDGSKISYETGFAIRITNASEEGLYNLYFHNCPNYDRNFDEELTGVSLSISIVEKNQNNYLSAGQIPLPSVYFFMSILFFLAACFWIFVLRKSSAADVFKIHYLMALLIYLKSFSLLFHGINYHFIETSGIHMEGWAVLYYVTHLLKGALLFITIVLIGTGWAWIKHVISDKEKKIFMIVIPLQVLANVAEIIIEESEKGESSHFAWREVFILVDLLCCGAILFPVVWSIRHLQEASLTDGKAAINLKKLKLFRHFYIMIVCYIYFTRIIVYLLRITVPFKYEWLDETCRAVATLVFFVMTGYKFRPASNNPYLQLSTTEDDEIEMEEVLTRSGAYHGLKKVGRNRMAEKDQVVAKTENSLEYD